MGIIGEIILAAGDGGGRAAMRDMGEDLAAGALDHGGEALALAGHDGGMELVDAGSDRVVNELLAQAAADPALTVDLVPLSESGARQSIDGLSALRAGAGDLDRASLASDGIVHDSQLVTRDTGDIAPVADDASDAVDDTASSALHDDAPMRADDRPAVTERAASDDVTAADATHGLDDERPAAVSDLADDVPHAASAPVRDAGDVASDLGTSVADDVAADTAPAITVSTRQAIQSVAAKLDEVDQHEIKTDETYMQQDEQRFAQAMKAGAAKHAQQVADTKADQARELAQRSSLANAAAAHVTVAAPASASLTGEVTPDLAAARYAAFQRA